MQRKFLGCIFVAILLVVAAGFVWALAGQRLMRAAMTPTIAFADSPRAPAPDYAQPAAWASRPGMADDPARFLPKEAAAGTPRAAAFFISGTTYLQRDRWNAPLDDAAANRFQADLLRAQASSLNAAAQIWSPRYRQATFGTFLDQSNPSARRALDLAYADVLRAFDAFVAAQVPDRPLLLMGHSQGGLHLMRLLRERVAGRPLARRVVAAYVVGWPVGVRTDLPTLGLPACTRAAQTGCVLSWQSFAADGDPAPIIESFEAGALDGRSRRNEPMLCTNPLTGGERPAGDVPLNMGTLTTGNTLLPTGPGAACDARGILRLQGNIPDVGSAVLPSGNYHVYDVQLFWANVRADAARRTEAWFAAR